MSAKLSSLRKRLATLEQQWADRARLEELADCNCPGIKSAVSFLAVCPRKFEEEINTMCPVHGLRRFGKIVIMNFVKPDGTAGEWAIKLHQLIESHNLRLAQHSQTGIAAEEDDESKEP
jgi:hypothetical protein